MLNKKIQKSNQVFGIRYSVKRNRLIKSSNKGRQLIFFNFFTFPFTNPTPHSIIFSGEQSNESHWYTFDTLSSKKKD